MAARGEANRAERMIKGLQIADGARVCDPQQLRQADGIGKELSGLEFRPCRGSPGRAPNHRAAPRFP